MQSILHNGDKLFVRQQSVAILVEYREHCVNQMAGQCETCANFYRSREFICVCPELMWIKSDS